MFYRITSFTGKLQQNVEQFSGQDSLGAVKVPLAKINIHNSSPLVLKAKEYLLRPSEFSLQDQTYSEWQILQKPLF